MGFAWRWGEVWLVRLPASASCFFFACVCCGLMIFCFVFYAHPSSFCRFLRRQLTGVFFFFFSLFVKILTASRWRRTHDHLLICFFFILVTRGGAVETRTEPPVLSMSCFDVSINFLLQGTAPAGGKRHCRFATLPLHMGVQ